MARQPRGGFMLPAWAGIVILACLVAGCTGPTQAGPADPLAPADGPRGPNGTGTATATPGSPSASTSPAGTTDPGTQNTTGGSTTTSGTAAPTTGTGTNTATGTQGARTTQWLDVSAFDYTESPFAGPSGVVIMAPPDRRWEPDFTYGSDGPEPLGEYPVGVLHEDGLVVRADGMVDCVASFQVPESYSDDRAVAVDVEFFDSVVHVYGEAIVGHATWDDALECPRA